MPLNGAPLPAGIAEDIVGEFHGPGNSPGSLGLRSPLAVRARAQSYQPLMRSAESYSPASARAPLRSASGGGCLPTSVKLESKEVGRRRGLDVDDVALASDTVLASSASAPRRFAVVTWRRPRDVMLRVLQNQRRSIQEVSGFRIQPV